MQKLSVQSQNYAHNQGCHIIHGAPYSNCRTKVPLKVLKYNSFLSPVSLPNCHVLCLLFNVVLPLLGGYSHCEYKPSQVPKPQPHEFLHSLAAGESLQTDVTCPELELIYNLPFLLATPENCNLHNEMHFLPRSGVDKRLAPTTE